VERCSIGPLSGPQQQSERADSMDPHYGATATISGRCLATVLLTMVVLSVGSHAGEVVTMIGKACDSTLTGSELRTAARNDALARIAQQHDQELVRLSQVWHHRGLGAEEAAQGFSDYILRLSRVYLEEIKSLGRGPDQWQSSDGRIILDCYYDTVRAEVSSLSDRVSRDLGLDLSLSSYTMKHGQTMPIEVSAQADCYVTVFCLFGSDSLKVLFPFPGAEDNKIGRGTSMSIPPASTGFSIRTEVPPGKQEEQAALMAVATPSDVPISRFLSDRSDGFWAGESALNVIGRWLNEICREGIDIDQVVYETVRE